MYKWFSLLWPHPPTVDHDLNKIEHALYQKAPCLDIFNVSITRAQGLKNVDLKV
jgi:hypothetical protein